MSFDPFGLIPAEDFIILAGLRSPGVATIKGAGSPRKWDCQDGYGFSGGSTRFIGNKLAKFDVEIAIWDPAHWVEWQAFSVLLKKPAGGAVIPMVGLGISHPLLNKAPLEITAVVVDDVSVFVQDEYGLWTCTIKFIEFARPKPALGKPLAEIPAASKAPPSAADKAIQARIDQAEALAKTGGLL